jgi:CheY-like chemotaxis protein
VIFLVEDTPSMRTIVAAMLRKLGHEDILEATDGKAAFEQLRMWHVDVALRTG